MLFLGTICLLVRIIRPVQYIHDLRGKVNTMKIRKLVNRKVISLLTAFMVLCLCFSIFTGTTLKTRAV